MSVMQGDGRQRQASCTSINVQYSHKWLQGPSAGLECQYAPECLNLSHAGRAAKVEYGTCNLLLTNVGEGLHQVLQV